MQIKTKVDDVPDALLNYRDAAALLRLKVGTLYSLVHSKQIPHLRLGRRIVRFQLADLREWLAAHRVESCGVATARHGGEK